jgi:hypothetical protein
MWAKLAAQILNFPRHLSQHSGGFVISRGKLTRLVPVENAAMPDRSAIQWDKDDLEALGLLKIDVFLAPPQVGVDGTTLNRPGPHDGDFDHEMVELSWLHARQHAHLCA